MSDYRTQARAIILGITGFILALLFIRLAIDIFEASNANSLISLIRSITDFFVEPFKNSYIFGNDSTFKSLNVDVLTALLAYGLLGIAISEIVTGFMYNDPIDIIVNVIDAIFKFFEFAIFLRIIFYFFGLSRSAKFVDWIFDITSFTQFPGLNISFLNDYLDWQAIFFLVIIAILDILAEGFLNSLLIKIPKKQVTTNTVTTHTVVPQAPVPVQIIQQPMPQPAPQHITVNVPAPVMYPPQPPRN